MKDYINIGSSPCDEKCAQVGTDGYYERAMKECRRFIELLRKVFGDEPYGARLAVKGFNHDFGMYHEVVCYFDDEIEESMDYAFKMEAETPQTWNG